MGLSGGVGLPVGRAVKRGGGGWAWGLALVALDGGWEGLWKKGGGVGPGGCWLGWFWVRFSVNFA